MVDKHRVEVGDSIAISGAALETLLQALIDAGYQPVGPKIRDGAIVYEPLGHADDLPSGYITEQAPGRFRLAHGKPGRRFDFIPGAASWKQYLFPPRMELFRLRRNSSIWEEASFPQVGRALAFVGVRPCELAAIQVQDRAFLRDDFTDPTYHDRRSKVFIIAVNCLHPAGTCFCASMHTGPKAESGYDLCLTELDEHFLIHIGSSLGRDIAQELPAEAASAFLLGTADAALQNARKQAVCGINVDTCSDTILSGLDHPRWEEVAKRCLSCGNCTLACPTCFCWDVTDQANLANTETARERVWDSCFNPSFSYQAGGNTRPSIRSRYRQWLSHKFGSWKQQYGVLGCVGCGRCITWCPAGIDTRIEVEALQQEAQR